MEYELEKVWESLRIKFIKEIQLQPYHISDIKGYDDERLRRGSQTIDLYGTEIVEKVTGFGGIVHWNSNRGHFLRVYKGKCRACGSSWCDRGERHEKDCPIGLMIEYMYGQAGEDRGERSSVSNRLDCVDAFMMRLKRMKEYDEKHVAEISRRRAEKDRLDFVNSEEKPN